MIEKNKMTEKLLDELKQFYFFDILNGHLDNLWRLKNIKQEIQN